MAKTPNTTTAPTGLIPPFGLRMLPELRDKIESAAKASGRSMNAEIVSRLENSFRSVDVENAAAILLENNHLKDQLAARERSDSVNDWVVTTLAKYLRDAVEELPVELRETKFAGIMGLANGIVHKDGSELFKFFTATALQVGEHDLAAELDAHKAEYEAIEDARINSLKIPVTVRGKKTEIVISGNLREPGTRVLDEERGANKPQTKWFERGFIYRRGEVSEVGGGTFFVARLTITDSAMNAGDADLIYAEIESVHRFNGADCTVWLDLAGDKVPKSVHEAIKHLVSFGVGLVVTLNGHSTLSSPESFDKKFIEDLKKSYRSGRAWCPIKQQLMFLVR